MERLSLSECSEYLNIRPIESIGPEGGTLKTKQEGVFLQIFNLISSMESYKNILICYPQSSDTGSSILEFDYFDIFKSI